ncbi:riboflavin synthase [Namhaeicola litoreus]|uniref:Riboflavin synthase n=1 Tax=Namhaeicola litoreus TaxID=1052145 RepID=A0ABW3XYV7_9FLAO
MFTGIIEDIGIVKNIEQEQQNFHITVESSISKELKIDQSLAHDGICLTVVNQIGNQHTVTAIQETMLKTNLGSLKPGSQLNLERAMILGARLDGHIVQGHVDQTGICKKIEDQDGSTMFTFTYDSSFSNITIEKGSITINGVSLTVVNSKKNSFSVAIIPYTKENTNFGQLKIGDTVNLEFDVIGKYVSKLLQQ